MNPNLGGLIKSIRNQEVMMMTHYLSSIFGTEDIEATGIDHTEDGMNVNYRYLNDGDIGTWNYPGSIDDFIHEQTLRLIIAQHSDLDY